MRATTSFAAILALVATAHTGAAHAEPDAPAADRAPTVDHTPLSRAKGGRPISLEVRVDADWRVDRLVLHARRSGDAEYTDVPFERRESGTYQALVPAVLVGEPGFEYAIDSLGRDGVARAHFASTAEPHRVVVQGRTDIQTQAMRLAAFDGHRSQMRVGGGLTAYGARRVDVFDPFAEGERDPAAETDALSDRYWLLQAEYLYRPLRLIHDFRFGVVVMRAHVPSVDGEALVAGDAPGINYGYSELTLEPHRWFTLGLRLVAGANEQGFVGGAGAVARIGSIERTHLAIGVEGISDLGTRTDVRFHWTTLERFPMALGIEFTDWPGGDDSPLAANLAYDLGYRVTNDLTLMARLGTANRAASLAVGWQGGLEMRYGF